MCAILSKHRNILQRIFEKINLHNGFSVFVRVHSNLFITTKNQLSRKIVHIATVATSNLTRLHCCRRSSHVEICFSRDLNTRVAFIIIVIINISLKISRSIAFLNQRLNRNAAIIFIINYY